MDLLVRYWDVSNDSVVVRYWNSLFLGYTTHLDLLKSFNEGLEGLDLSKLVQVSMDGSKTNLKFLQELKKGRAENELSSLIDIVSCSLHIIHGAFKTGSEATDWKSDKVLNGAYKVLHDSPARRDDYHSISGSSTYPLQFCGTRWVEDKKVAEKSIELWPNMTQLEKLRECQMWY